jgi:hypothetical protein
VKGRFVKIAMLFLSLGLLFSCASTIQTYEGEPKDRSQIAVVSATNGATVTRSTMVHSVDGVRGPNFVYGHYVYNNANFAAMGCFVPYVEPAPGKTVPSYFIRAVS